VALDTYQPRGAEGMILHGLVRDHLDTFLRDAAERTDGAGVPRFVEKEFREFLTCGVLARGFARVRCGDCAYERLVPFSCKGRGFCPSCGGRRMTEQAAHLVDEVLPRVPVRQWVLSVPHRLRYLLAWNHQLCRAVLAVYVRAVLGLYRRRARRRGVKGAQGGAVTVIQRFGGGLNLNVHFHTLVLDGVFAGTAEGSLEFHATAPPTDADVARLLATVRRRVQRLLARRALDGGDASEAPSDPLAEESPALAGISSASVQGRVALGPRAGARVLQIGREPNAPWVTSRGPRQAHLEGFDLHANLAVPADDRQALERLCRYVLRPPVAQDRLELTSDGRVLVTLKGEWSDGTTHLLFEPVELLEKLAALTPRPRINLVLYHGVLAPHARWRALVVAHDRARAGSPADADPVALDSVEGCPNPAPEAGSTRGCGAPTATADQPGPSGASKPRHWTWANLMRRAFDLDVLACPRCGGRMSVIATIDDPRVIRKILDHLGLPTEVPQPRPARPPPASSDLFS
jgi:Putative transposase/Transposase zinc-binding domain